MALSMRMYRDKVRFEWNDGVVESVVTLSSKDTEEAAVSKLKRVIALVEGAQASDAPEYVLRRPKYPALDAINPATGNAWAAVYGPPALPARLQGEVELVQPEEGA